MREEYELEVLERYDIEVKSTRKVRGAFFCETNEGTMLLKETKISGQRAPFLHMILSCLEEKGRVHVDTPVFTREGELLVTSRDSHVYMLKKWYHGRECEIRQEADALRAARLLAVLHRELREPVLREKAAGYLPVIGRMASPLDEIRRHNRELKKVRKFIRARVTKNEFEYLFLESFENMYGLAEKVREKMEDSGCGGLYEDSLDRCLLVHGEYNYHNILFSGGDEAVTNFEHMKPGIQIYDLYYFLRKAMEKYSWKQKTGRNILEAYESVCPLTEPEREYIGLRLAYPEKYWKAAGSYYRTNKAWISEKNVEKLRLAVCQSEEKRAFLSDVFSVSI